MTRDRKNFKSKVKKWCHKEFNPKNFSLVHPNHHLFVESQWSRGRISRSFLCYRVIAALLLTTWCVLDIWVEVTRWFKSASYLWLLFATNWSFIILTGSSIVSAINVVRFYRRQRREMFQADIPAPPLKTDCFLSFQWLLDITGYNLAILVSVAFWAFVFVFEGPDMSSLTPAFLKSGMSIAKHTVNTVYVMVDLWTVATPVRLLHVVYPVGLGLLYSLVYAVYFLTGGEGPFGENHIYEMLDWSRDPVSSGLACLFAFSTMILSQLILYMIYRIRKAVWARLAAGKGMGDDDGNHLADDFSMDEEEEEDDDDNDNVDIERVGDGGGGDGDGGGGGGGGGGGIERDIGTQEAKSTLRMPVNYHAIN